jgi:flagellar operon protein
MNPLNNGFLSIEQVSGQYFAASDKSKKLNANLREGLSFQEVLDKAAGKPLTFSRHASARLGSRNIELSTKQIQRLSDATEQASKKGIKESLVLLDQMAFIVNIPHNTVVTALPITEDTGAQTTQNIFTNIDGAVIA